MAGATQLSQDWCTDDQVVGFQVPTSPSAETAEKLTGGVLKAFQRVIKQKKKGLDASVKKVLMVDIDVVNQYPQVYV